MVKMMKPKGKKVKGEDYAEADEKYDKKALKKEGIDMKTAGLALNLKKSEKDEGYSKKPRVKPQKKNAKITKGQGKAAY